MPRQDLRAREEAIIVDELQGKVSIQQACEHFEKRGLIVADEDAIRQWKLDQARGILERSRKYRKKTKEIQLEIVNLFETTEDGGTIHYWRKFGELTPEEGAQLLESWNGRINQGLREFHRYYKPLLKKHGRKLKQLIWFEIPPRPNTTEAT
jgi:hypothetical protein